MKKNRMYKYLLLALSSLLFVSCDKENGAVGEDLGKQSTLTLEMTAGMPELEIYDFDAKTGEAKKLDDLRITSIGQGYSKAPKLRLDLEDIIPERMGAGFYKDETMHDKTVARWGIVNTSGKFVQANNNNEMTSDPDFGESGRGQHTIVLEEKSGRQFVRMYYTWTNAWDFSSNDTFACMLISGDNPKQSAVRKIYPYQHYFDDERHTNPNAEVIGITKDAMEKRHIPLLTHICRVESPNYTDKNNQASGKTASITGSFHIRGALLGLRLDNELGEDIIIKKIEVEDLDNSPFYYQGYFDWRTPINGQTIPSTVKEVPMSFVPITHNYAENEPYGVFPVYHLEGGQRKKNYTLTTGAMTEDNSPVFYVWGYPRADKLNESFKYRVLYAKASEPNVDYLSKIIAVKAPATGFKEGVAYRTTTPVKFGVKLEAKVTNPLSYLAKFDVANSQDAFVTIYDVPESDVLASLKPTDVGYFSYDEVNQIYNTHKSGFLKDYVVPTAEQCASVFPARSVVHFDSEQSDSQFNETVMIGNDPVSGGSEYHTINEGGEFVTYALRFKGTKWVSAWRYHRDGGRLHVGCVAGSKLTNASLNDISKPSFFVGVNLVTRTFPAYGYVSPYGATDKAEFMGSSGGFWSSSTSVDVPTFASASYFHLDNGGNSVASVNANTAKAYRYAFRPYYKVAPQD